MDIAKEVDARGLNCPLPILKAKKALADMASGQVLKVLATYKPQVKSGNINLAKTYTNAFVAGK